MRVDKLLEAHQSMSLQVQGTAFIQPELTSGISGSDINTVSQNEVETVEVSSCRRQMKPVKQEGRRRKKLREENRWREMATSRQHRVEKGK